MQEKWLAWAQEIQSIAQAGLEYTRDPFDRERFERLRNLSVQIVSEYTGISDEKVRDLFAGETGYQTPKVDVRAVVHKEGKLLFVKELDNKWALPGGWAEPNLSLRENVSREVLEEAGVSVEPLRVLAILDRNKHTEDTYPYSVYKIFVQCRYLDGQFESNIETSDAGFFARDNIPELSIIRNTARQIDLCFESISGGSHEAIFD
jgi:ADP-ribose pyrophosphatase YjhB (NUDIX family)